MRRGSFCGIQDGLPNMVMEAGAMGKVVIANPHPALKKIIQDQQTGFFVAPEDQTAIYTLVDQVLASSTLRRQVGTAARELIRAHFSAEAVAKSFESSLSALSHR